MERLTKKDNKGKYYIVALELGIGGKQVNPITNWIEDCEERNYGNPIDKLGKLEDLMEKYEINSIEALEEIIKDYDDMAKDIVEMGLGVKMEFKGKSE